MKTRLYFSLALVLTDIGMFSDSGHLHGNRDLVSGFMFYGANPVK